MGRTANSFALAYIRKAAVGVPRDLANSVVSQFKPIRPTVLIYNCTWVCDARCTMCNNWKRGDRKSDMTLEQLEPAMAHPFWGAVENLNISGGEPTTRNDLPEMVEMFHRRLPRLRKIGINTTGLTPQRAIPMLDAHRRVLRREGAPHQHPRVARRHRRHPQPGAPGEARLRQGLADDRGDAGSRPRYPNFQFGIAATIFATNLRGRPEHPRLGARAQKLDIVFNMLRFTDAMLGNSDLEGRDRLRRAAKRSSCASSSSIASRRSRS